MDAIGDATGSSRVVVRLSTLGRLYDLRLYPEEKATWMRVAAELNERELEFVYQNYQPTLTAVRFTEGFYKLFRLLYKGMVIGAGGFHR